MRQVTWVVLGFSLAICYSDAVAFAEFVDMSCSPSAPATMSFVSSHENDTTLTGQNITCSGTGTVDADDSLGIVISGLDGSEDYTLTRSGGSETLTVHFTAGSGLSAIPSGTTTVSSGNFSFVVQVAGPDVSGKPIGSYINGGPVVITATAL